MRTKQVLLFGIMVLSLGACGYQFQGSGSVLPDDVKTIAVLPVDNETTESGLALSLKEALQSEFERYGAVQVVDRADLADAQLKARVLRVETGVKSVTGQTDIALELDLIMTLAAELRKTSGQLLWSNPSMRVSDSFESVGDVVVTSSSSFEQGNIGADSLGALGAREVSRSQKEEALLELVSEVSRKIYLEAVAADF